MMKTILALLLFSTLAQAAPHPTTSSSILASAEEGYFFKSLGFKMSTKGTLWTTLPVERDSMVQSVKLGPMGSESNAKAPRLSVRVDKIDKKMTLETYSKKWMRDYTNFGFETLGNQVIQLGGGKALVVDLIQRKQNKQLRQIVLNKDQKVAVLTCIDEKDKFAQTLPICNHIARSFEWGQ